MNTGEDDLVTRPVHSPLVPSLPLTLLLTLAGCALPAPEDGGGATQSESGESSAGETAEDTTDLDETAEGSQTGETTAGSDSDSDSGSGSDSDSDSDSGSGSGGDPDFGDACSTHAECAPAACHFGLEQCFPADNVRYVNRDACSDGAAGSIDDPLCSIGAAFESSPGGPLTVRVAASEDINYVQLDDVNQRPLAILSSEAGELRPQVGTSCPCLNEQGVLFFDGLELFGAGNYNPLTWIDDCIVSAPTFLEHGGVVRDSSFAQKAWLHSLEPEGSVHISNSEFLSELSIIQEGEASTTVIDDSYIQADYKGPALSWTGGEGSSLHIAGSTFNQLDDSGLGSGLWAQDGAVTIESSVSNADMRFRFAAVELRSSSVAVGAGQLALRLAYDSTLSASHISLSGDISCTFGGGVTQLRDSIVFVPNDPDCNTPDQIARNVSNAEAMLGAGGFLVAELLALFIDPENDLHLDVHLPELQIGQWQDGDPSVDIDGDPIPQGEASWAGADQP